MSWIDNYMKSSDDKKDDTSSFTVKERRLQTNTVLKELLQITPPMAPDEMNESGPTKSFVVPDHLIAGVMFPADLTGSTRGVR